MELEPASIADKQLLDDLFKNYTSQLLPNADYQILMSMDVNLEHIIEVVSQIIKVVKQKPVTIDDSDCDGSGNAELFFRTWSEHHYDGQNIIMMVRTSLWWSEHHYDGQNITMMVRTSL